MPRTGIKYTHSLSKKRRDFIDRRGRVQDRNDFLDRLVAFSRVEAVVTPLLPIRTKGSCPGVIAFGRHVDVADLMSRERRERAVKKRQPQGKGDDDCEATRSLAFEGRVEMGLPSNGKRY